MSFSPSANTQHLPFEENQIAIVAITRDGIAHAGKLLSVLPQAQLFAPEKFRAEAEQAGGAQANCFSGKTGDQVPALFEAFAAIIAVVSLGAVVRLIAPHLAGKDRDPGVVVVDEGGRWAIPVLSGHLGGANALAARLSQTLGCTPVLTTASDAQQTLAVDLLGRELGWSFVASHAEVLRASAAMVNGEAVALVQEAGRRDWWPNHATGRTGIALPANLSLFDSLAALEAHGEAAFAAVLWIGRSPQLPAAWQARLAGRCVRYDVSAETPAETPAANSTALALGLGCDRGTSAQSILTAVDAALAQIGAGREQIKAIASIDLKADEIGLLAAAAMLGVLPRFYPARVLADVDTPNPSAVVQKYTGTPSVSEAAALLAAQAKDHHALLLEKLRHRADDGKNATVSIARITNS